MGLNRFRDRESLTTWLKTLIFSVTMPYRNFGVTVETNYYVDGKHIGKVSSAGNRQLRFHWDADPVEFMKMAFERLEKDSPVPVSTTDDELRLAYDAVMNADYHDYSQIGEYFS